MSETNTNTGDEIMVQRSKREGSTETIETPAEETPVETVAEGNGSKPVSDRMPTIVMEEVAEFPEATRSGGRTGPSDKWTKALADVASNKPGKIVKLAVFKSDVGATNARLRIVGGGKNDLPTQLPKDTDHAKWEVVARRTPDDENKSALFVRYTP